MGLHEVAHGDEGLMFVFALVPLIFGYVLASRVLKERQWQRRAPVAYALALTCFLCGVNALFHFVSLRHAVYGTVALMGVILLGLLRLKPVRASSATLGRLEAVVLIVFTMTICFWTLFWQMKYSDDDIFPNAPNMAFYLRDIFPAMNPLYPDVPLHGHYGRNLTISALSVFFGERFLQVQYVVTALNQGAIVLLIYFISKRYLRSARAALLGVILGFMGVNDTFREGLADAFVNNNSFAYLFLFANAYLYLVALTRRDNGSKAVAALSLGTYAIVYETHYGILLIAFLLFPLLLMARRGRWRPRYLGVTAVIVFASIALATVEGGVLSEVASRHLSAFQRAAKPTAVTDFALVEQHVALQFPKARFAITSWDGTEYSVFSRKLLSESSVFVLFLPLGTGLMFVLKRYWALMVAVIGDLAILVPASVDFGAFNGESFRFMFFAGVAAAIVCGMTVGLGLDWMSRSGRAPIWATAGVAALVIWVCSESEHNIVRELTDVAKRGQEYYWNPEEWACNGVTRVFCDPLDAEAMIQLRPVVKPGERLLTNTSLDRLLSAIQGHAILSTLSGAYVEGHGIVVSRERVFAMGKEYRAAAGFRALAFWHTADMSILRRMPVQYIFVDPSRLAPAIYEKLKREEELKVLVRKTDEARGEVREIYRVVLPRPEASTPLPPDLALVAAEFPTMMAPAGFFEVPLVATTAAKGTFDGRVEIGYRIRFKDLVMNPGDHVEHVMRMEHAGDGRWVGKMLFIAPYEAGEYQVEMYTLHGSERRPLRRATGQDAVYTIRVS
jgi:hypothetical protein